MANTTPALVGLSFATSRNPEWHAEVPDAQLFKYLRTLAGESANADAVAGVVCGFLVRDENALAECIQAYPSLSAAPFLEGERVTLACSGTSFSEACGILAAVEALQQTHPSRQTPKPGMPADEALNYANALVEANAPYFLRYLFLKTVARSPEDFAILSPVVAAADMCFQFGHTQRHRQTAIEPHLPGGALLVEVGCGPAYYLRRLSSRYTRLVGFEAAPTVKKEAHRVLQHHAILNAQVFGAFDERAYIPGGAHVLMTEVLEHMPRDVAEGLLRHLATQRAARMVFTVPNREFNQHYLLAAGEFRHPDHDWEPDQAEFEALMKRCLSPRWVLQFEPVGDRIAGISSGLLCLAMPRQPEAAGVTATNGWCSAGREKTTESRKVRRRF